VLNLFLEFSLDGIGMAIRPIDSRLYLTAGGCIRCVEDTCQRAGLIPSEARNLLWGGGQQIPRCGMTGRGHRPTASVFILVGRRSTGYSLSIAVLKGP
jgi:hypothetical protein